MQRRSPNDLAVHCDDLSVARGGVRVVEGVTLRLEPARSLALMGPTGAGKSSLAAVLAGADDASLAVVGGAAHVAGISVRKGGRARRILDHCGEGGGRRTFGRSGLRLREERERSAGRALFGPHRDDLVLLSGTLPLAARASSGEARALGDSGNHWLTIQIEKRLGGQARGCVACRNNNLELYRRHGIRPHLV